MICNVSISWLALCSLKSTSRTKYPIKVLVHFRISPVYVFISKLDQLNQRYLLNKKGSIHCHCAVQMLQMKSREQCQSVGGLDEKYPQVVSSLHMISNFIRIWRHTSPHHLENSFGYFCTDRQLWGVRSADLEITIIFTRTLSQSVHEKNFWTKRAGYFSSDRTLTQHWNWSLFPFTKM